MVHNRYDREALKRNEKVGDYIIQKHIGLGALTLVYKALHTDRKMVYILKEYYPSNLNIHRTGNVLNVPDENKAEYNRKKAKFKKAFDEALKIYDAPSENTSTSMSLPEEFIIKNNTYYAVYKKVAGFSYDKRIDSNGVRRDNSLMEIFRIGHRVAEITAKYHRLGYLCLDIKEENILISDEIEENGRIDVLMFDFDSLIEKDRFQDGEINTISFTKTEFMPDELANEDFDQIDESTDMFLIADMIHHRIFNTYYEYNPGTLGLAFKYLNCKYLSEYEFEDQKRIADKLEDFFKKAFNRDKKKRHSSVEDFIKNLEEIISELNTCNVVNISNGTIKYARINKNELPRHSLRMRNKFCENEKFRTLQGLKILENRLLVKSEDKIISPMEACLKNSRLLLVGDGGMGKTTSLFEYWYDTSHKRICFLIELNKYSYETRLPDNDGFSSFILAYLVKSVNNDGSTDYKAVPSDKQYMTQIGWFDNFFAQTTEPYSIMLDGLNEIDDYSREQFIQELKHYSKKWKNVQFIITSRKKYDNIPDEFMTYSFIGLSEETKESFLRNKYTAEEIEDIKQNTQLWNILDVPLFINIFSGEKMSAGCQSRGEILDYFFTSHKDSEMYSEGTIQEHMPNSDEAEVRRFLIKYMLPFVANYMDINGSHTILTKDCIDAFDNCYKLYTRSVTPIVINKKAFKNYRSLNLFDIESFDANRLYNLLTDNLCYFSYTSSDNNRLEFSHQYFRDYFAAKYVLNIISYSQHLNDNYNINIIDFISKYGLNYRWSDDVALLIGDMTQEYKKA